MENRLIISAGAVIVRWEKQRFLYLLLRAHNFWDFPKGQMEPNESTLSTALREIEEETTLTSLKFTWGQDYYETKPYFRGRKIARYYLAETDQRMISLPINPELGHPEHSAWRWVTRKQAINMVTPRVREVILWTDQFLQFDVRTRQL